MEDDHVESFAEQEVLGLAAMALDGHLATACAECFMEAIGVLGQNKDPHTLRVSVGAGSGLQLRTLRELLAPAQSPLRSIGNDGRRKLVPDEKKETEMQRNGGDGFGFSPEQLQLELSLLAVERQRLRESGGSRELLENNRLKIGRWQYELSRALIRRHLGQPARRAA